MENTHQDFSKKGENMENVVITVVAPEEIRNKAKQKLDQELKESTNKEFAGRNY